MPGHTIVLLYPGCIAYEIMLAVELMGRVFPVEVVTPDGADHRASGGFTVRANGTPESIGLDDAAAVLIPGGDPGSVVENDAIDRMLRRADEQGTLIGAICAGPLLLGKAGLLRATPARPARRFTHGYGPDQMPFVGRFFEGGLFERADVVVDGTIITARAEGHIDFGIEIAKQSGALSTAYPAEDIEACALRLRRFFKGPVPAL